MSDNRRKSFWLGLFVLGAFALLGALVLIFGSLPSLFQARERYTIRFEDAPGIGPGTPIRRSGVRVGEVESVQLEADGKVRVSAALTPKFRPRKSDKPTLITGLIGGDASIDFLPDEPELGKPPPDMTPLEPGSELLGLRGANVNALLNRASDIVPTTQETMVDIRRSLARLERSAPLIDNALREIAEISKAGRESLPDVRRTLDELRELAKTVREAVPEAKEISNDIAKITAQVRDGMPELRETNKQIQKMIRSIDDVVPEAKKLIQSVNEAVPDARELLKGIREAVPDARKAMAEGTEFLKAVRDEIPELHKTNNEAREFIKSLRESVPDVRRAIDEGRELFKSVREVVPDVKQLIEDIGATARRATRLGEQIGNVITENREKVTQGLDKFVKLIEDVSRTVDRVTNILSEENQRTINEIIRSIRDTANKGPDIARGVNEILVDVKANIKKIEPVFDSVTRTIESVSKTFDNLSTTIGPLVDTVQKILNPLVDRAPSLARNLDESVAQVNTILRDVRNIVRVVGESDGTLNRILTDPRLFNRIDAILYDVQRLTPKLDQIVKDFTVFSDKLARHPEAIGVGGVVRPGDGLKNPPTVPGTLIRP